MEGRASESATASGIRTAHPARAWPSVTLGEDAVGDVAVDVCQAALDAVVVEGQLFVIDAHQVQYGGVEVVPVHRVLDCLPADLSGLLVAAIGLHPKPASQQENP